MTFVPGDDEQYDSQWAICPKCGEGQGDCWEWCPSDVPVKTECHICGTKFEAWSEYEVTIYTSIIKDS